MNPLESRKQLLIAESELNRAQLAGGLTALTKGARALTYRASALGVIASSAAVLVTGLAALQRGQPAGAGAKPSRVQALLNGTVLISILWLAFRAQDSDRSGS